jgi:magnesium chelatase family protein
MFCVFVTWTGVRVASNGDPTRECRCTGAMIQRYMGKLSGPLLDRIDMHIEVPALPYQDLRTKPTGDTSKTILERVQNCRRIQVGRGFYNNQIPSSKLRDVASLDASGERILETAVQRLGLSARAHDRILKVARTIADLDGKDAVASKHLAEAVQYRSLDRIYMS